MKSKRKVTTEEEIDRIVIAQSDEERSDIEEAAFSGFKRELAAKNSR